MGYENPYKVRPNYAYCLWAYLTPTKTTNEAGRLKTFPEIFTTSPSDARYAVVTNKGETLVFDIYETTLVHGSTTLKPCLVKMKFGSVEHALAAMRIGYKRDTIALNTHAYTKSAYFWNAQTNHRDTPKYRK